MRSPVYRNLDKAFEIFGFNSLELIFLCFALVGGGELFELFGISRVWSFLFTLVFALALFLIRRHLGEMFSFRMFRFLSLPSSLRPKMMSELKEAEK